LNKDTKQQLVAELTEKLKTAKASFLADYRGLTVEEVNDLRGKLRDAAGTEYRVVKNTLLKLAMKETDAAQLTELLSGPTAIAIAQGDVVAPAKALSEYAKSNDKFELKGAVLEGQLIDLAGIKALADLPSREVLLSQVLSSINAPATNFVCVLSAVPRSLVQVLSAIKDQKEAA